MDEHRIDFTFIYHSVSSSEEEQSPLPLPPSMENFTPSKPFVYKSYTVLLVLRDVFSLKGTEVLYHDLIRLGPNRDNPYAIFINTIFLS